MQPGNSLFDSNSLALYGYNPKGKAAIPDSWLDSILCEIRVYIYNSLTQNRKEEFITYQDVSSVSIILAQEEPSIKYLQHIYLVGVCQWQTGHEYICFLAIETHTPNSYQF